MPSTALPIEPFLPEVAAALKAKGRLVLEAPPGAGKTTQVPRHLLEAGLAGDGQILVLQPRRLPTRLAARFIAQQMGEAVGERVGYQVRFEDVSSEKTRLLFMTEGLLTRRMLVDPQLRGVAAVVLDEFHERHLATDIALALLKSLQASQRPDLKILAMSATLDAGPIAAYLDHCPLLKSEGRRFAVTTHYLPLPDERPLDTQVLAAVKRLLAANLEGDVLVFLPGASDIRRAAAACEELAGRHALDIRPLHGDLSPAEQDRAIAPSKNRKLILSTNVAETSVTLEGVVAVIDSGLAKTAGHSPWSGLPTLKLAKISQSSAIQREGRAGRVREGVCLRLYTRHDFDGRPRHDAPEISRLDLTETLLWLKAWGARDVSLFPFFEAPPKAAVEAALALLSRLGALEAGQGLTEVGKRLLRFPLHPRLARIVVEGERRGVGKRAALAAALLAEKDIRKSSRARMDRGFSSRPDAGNSPSDVLELCHLFEEAESAQFSPDALRRLNLDPQATRSVQRAASQLRRLAAASTSQATSTASEEALCKSVLAGFPDRLAKRQKALSNSLVLSEGGSAVLDESSAVREAELMVAVDAEERPKAPALVRLASQVEAEWLLELYPEQLSETEELSWNSELGRVDQTSRLTYGKLVLDEVRKPAPASEESAALLAQALLRGEGHLIRAEEVAGWEAKWALWVQAAPALQLPRWDEDFLKRSVQRACEGKSRLDEATGLSLSDFLLSQLTPEQANKVLRLTPERVPLGKRTVPVHYEKGKPPWVESRLQDFFGRKDGPALADGRIPLVLHLLAPNGRAVQVTTDLSGFWERHYPSIRKELMRKYPRHAWPENPLLAQPPEPKGRPR
jgi:ATP-dependent helicase HrpB